MAQPVILAGDVGGTKTLLALGTVTASGFTCSRLERYASRDYPNLQAILTLFLSGSPPPPHSCLGVPGPVLDNRCRTTNLPWEIDIPSIQLINDLEAMGWGLPWASETVCIQQGIPRSGNQAILAPGTGLGEAGLFWDGERHHPWASEGGHADFAPRTDIEIELLHICQRQFGHASTERIVSGTGLELLAEFFKESPDVALDQFVASLGAEAGNLALKLMATGGLYLAGGTVRHLAPELQSPQFLDNLHNKGRFRPLMEQLPVYLITDELVALKGAARYAFQSRMAGSSRS